MDTDLKEKLTDLFCKLPGISYPYRQSGKKSVNAVLMIKHYLPPTVGDGLKDKFMLFTHFYICNEKNSKHCLYRQQTGNILTLTPQVFCQHIDKNNYSLVQLTVKYVFHRSSYKNTCFS